MSEEEETEDSPERDARYPLAYDANGNPIDVPAGAVAWRVRRGGGRRGRPRHVFDPETGRQLEVPLAATLDTLIDAGCSGDRYLLYPVDALGHVLIGPVGVTEVPQVEEDSVAPASSTEQGVLFALITHQLATIKEQSQTLCRALEATTSGYGRVRPIEAPPIMMEAPAPADSGGNFKPEQITEIATIAKSIFEMFKGAGGTPPTGGGGG